jgi:hypothetical protein
MKTVLTFSDQNTTVPIGLAIYKIFIESKEYENSISKFQSLFEILKANKFNFSGNNIDKIDNYSNFLINKIEVDDFKEIKINDLPKILEDNLSEWSNTYNNCSIEEFKWYIKAALKQIKHVAFKHYKKSYVFDLPATSNHNKRHPHYSLYEFFMSVIFFENISQDNEVVYVEFWYD